MYPNYKQNRRKKIVDENRIDILYLDKKIKAIINEENSMLIKYKSELKQSENDIETEKNYIKRKSLIEKVEQLKKIISEIENNTKMAEYVYLSNKIVDKYNKLNEIPVSVSFFDNKKIDPNEKEKEQLLNEYIDIANRYIEIPNNKTNKIEIVTCVCGHVNEYKDNECVECGELFNNNDNVQQTSYKDIDRVNLSQKYKYKRKVHFRDTVNQYQGKQNKKIDPKVYDDLENEFIKHKLLIEDEKSFYKKHEKITKEHIQMFLSETNHNNYYEDIQLIHNYFTGIPCPDLSLIEESLYEDFDKVVDAFTKLDNLERLNFLNGSYILYQLLKRQNVKVSEYDFDFLKTRERKLVHDELFSRICVELEWNMQMTC